MEFSNFNDCMPYFKSFRFSDYSQTINDYRGFKIDIHRILNSKFAEDGVYILINDVNTHVLRKDASIKNAEVIAKLYVDDVLVPQIESLTLPNEVKDNEIEEISSEK